MGSPREVRRTMSRIANMVVNGELTIGEANAVTYCCNSILTAIRVDDQAAAINELEEMVLALERRASLWGGKIL